MSQLNLTNIADTSISTPASGLSTVYFDNINKSMKRKIDTGYVNSYTNLINTTAQSPVAATRTYIAGTGFKVSAIKLQVGSCFRWVFNMTKTAAGISASTFDICVGTAGTTADTARVSFTKPAGLGTADEGVVTIIANIKSIGVAGVMVGEFTMVHNGNTTGHMIIPVACINTISAGFDTTVAGLQVGVCITTGALDAITIQMVQGEAWDM